MVLSVNVNLLPDAINRPFRVITFDWDGTAVENRTADARPVATRLEALLKAGVYIAIVTGTSFRNIDNQFCRLLTGAHKRRLYVLTNRGSEVFGFDEDSEPVLVHRYEATETEDLLLTRVAEGVRDYVQEGGGPPIAIVYDRLNRRKIDLIPEPEWADPPKSQIGSLLKATEQRLKQGGISGGIRELFVVAEALAREAGLVRSRITSDVKHIEVGLTDKSDSVAWIEEVLSPLAGAGAAEILVAGDEFGPIAGFEGSDFKMVTGRGETTVVSVGPEPGGVPEGVIHLGGGPRRFLDVLDLQISIWSQTDLKRN